MAHQLDVYSRTAGLRIDKMQLFEHFYPLPVEGDYIVFVTSAGAATRAYDYYKEVLWLLKDSLKEANITTVQCGLKDDLRVGCDVDVCGMTDFNQFFYVMSNAKLIICGDTSALHIAGHYNIPVVSLFSISDPRNSGAFFGDKSKQIYLSPNFEGYRPSFDPNEYPKSINRINPERIANGAAQLLNIEPRNIQTINIGSRYSQYMIEVIPDHTFASGAMPGIVLNIRLDLGGKEEIAFHFLSQRKCNFITKEPVNIHALKMFKHNLENFIYEIDDNYDLKFIDSLKKAGISYALMTDFTQDKIDSLKELFMDYGMLQKRGFKRKEDIINYELINSKTKFRTGKCIISQGRLFMSKAHLNNDESMISADNNEGTIIDNPEFWRDQEFFFMFNDN